MTWNYRVVHQDAGAFSHLAICEAYYAEDETLRGCTEPVPPVGDDLAELAQCLERMAEALKKPIISAADFAGGEPPSPP